jgi:hypothetical protein
LGKSKKQLEGKKVFGAIHQQVEKSTGWKEGKPKIPSTVIMLTNMHPFLSFYK